MSSIKIKITFGFSAAMALSDKRQTQKQIKNRIKIPFGYEKVMTSTLKYEKTTIMCPEKSFLMIIEAPS